MSAMTTAQRQQRCNIRNAMLVASVDELNVERQWHQGNADKFAVACIDEILAECHKHGVDNFGDTPAF